MRSNLGSQRLAALEKSLRKYDFVLVIPWQEDELSMERPLEQLGPLIKLLAAREGLVAISGSHRKFPNWSFCSLKRIDQISIQMKEIGQEAAKDSDGCFLCNVLPDIFLARSQFLLGNLPTVARLGASAFLQLFLEAAGRSALCPDFDMTSRGLSTSQDFTCNGLPIFFDGKFALYPKLNIWRLLVGEAEFWLGCVWSKSSVKLGLPIACSNWNGQMLFQIADIFRENFPTVGFHVGYGTLLGALRQKDVIPWSYDVDLMLKLSPSQYDRFAGSHWHSLPNISRWRYSDKDRNFWMESFGGNLSRAFPICPKRFILRHQTENVGPIISEIRSGGGQKSSLDRDLWSVQAAGYLDLYPFEYTPECFRKLGIGMTGADGAVEIGRREFPAPGKAVELVQCIYGRNWRHLPACAKGNWKTYC